MTLWLPCPYWQVRGLVTLARKGHMKLPTMYVFHYYHLLHLCAAGLRTADVKSRGHACQCAKGPA